MNFKNTVIAQQKKWILLHKLGEGDAGEVYLVESLLEGKPAILKRPRNNAFPSDILRQASQIRNEGKILKALSGISFPGEETRLSTPALIDQSLPEDGFGERFFIVIEQAAGFDLKSLFRLTRSGLIDEIHFPASNENKFFVQTLSELKTIPESIIIHSLTGLIILLETIHFTEVWNDGVKQYGVIWNDIKPEHLYWDPARTCLTVIDWGNGNFLEEDRATRDRHHSFNNDYHQFIQAMGAFLSESNADLYALLEWPQEITPGSAYSEGVKPLKERLVSLQEEALKRSKDLRTAESNLYEASRPSLDRLLESDNLQRRIVAQGEMPDFPSAVNFHARGALQMAAENNLEAFQQICLRTAKLATSNTEKWELLAEIAGIAIQLKAYHEEISGEAFSHALSAGIADDWSTLLWDLFELIGDGPLPDWWDNVTQGVQNVHLNLDKGALTPDVVVKRLFYTLQTAVLQMEDQNQFSDAEGDNRRARELLAREDILKIFDEEVVKKWKEIDPAPPNSGIGYRDIEGVIEDIETILPGTQENLGKVLTQPKAQAEIVLNAWEHKDFETASQALRRLLLWDPNRRRLLQADRAIAMASQWLLDIRNGAKSDEPFYDYLISVELAGRNLRNRVGPAPWLDVILDALKRLRKGFRPADLIMEHPEISDEMPWLNEFRSREILSLPRTHALALDRDETVSRQVKTVTGVKEGILGPDSDLLLGEPLDTWAPEARGSSARVFAGQLRYRTNKQLPSAIKIMRPDQDEYALPLFKEEAHILSMLGDVPGVTPLVECGFLRLEDEMDFPSDESQAPAAHLRGELIRYGVEEVQNFLVAMEGQMARGWLPYLALVKRDQQHNLMKYCDAGYNRGWFLPLRESLLLAIQICDILQIAHDRKITYRDHKILHYYWHPDSHGVVMIDWNIAKRHSQGLSEAERQFDLAQFGARALHHILTGRPATGALPLGPNRPEEIEHASLSYPVNWTYDDERLPIRVKEIMQQVLNQGYTLMRDLRADLIQVYQQVPGPVQDTAYSDA